MQCPWRILALVLGCVLPVGAQAAGAAQFMTQGEALARLFNEAEAQKSNGLYVHERGIPVRESLFGTRDRKIPMYSVTKVFTGIAVGIAIDQGLIPSIDEPISTYFSEVAADPMKSRITVRHLLQHTSGIVTTQGSKDIYPQKDFVRFALDSDVVSAPGEVFRYNNRAINIASGIVGKATGRTMEAYLAEHLFKPLGIEDYRFPKDKAGTTWGMDGLQLKVSDLVKVGTMLAQKGRWQGKVIVSERWLAVASQASLLTVDTGLPYGMALFCLDLDGRVALPADTLALLEKGGLEPRLAETLRPFADREFARARELGVALKAVLSTADLERISAVAGRAMVPLYVNLDDRKLIAHDGEIGEILIAFPGYGISIARTIDDARGRGKPHGLREVYTLAYRLLPPLKPKPAP